MSYISCIKKIEAVGGFVVLTVHTAQDRKKITITIQEALDRAEAIKMMTTEDEKHKKSQVLYAAFMDVAMTAKEQLLEMDAEELVEQGLDEQELRRLEVYSINRTAHNKQVSSSS